ncbi:MAG TPA: response regulator [Patescibacteria group bacterium]|jgi:CheY-like chemotaxis protein|nr:response regulator [Patescibacteria group bacterium]
MLTKLLLHVDDDADEAFLLDRALRKTGLNWAFQHVPSGKAALEYVTRVKIGEMARPDLMVLDVRMPLMSGLEVLEWMSNNAAEIPAVMLSSSDLLIDRLQARDLGSKGYFVKSADFADLLEFLRGWDETSLAAPVNAQSAQG